MNALSPEFVATRLEYLKDINEITEEEYGIMLLKVQEDA
jgi:hypothetical protein